MPRRPRQNNAVPIRPLLRGPFFSTSLPKKPADKPKHKIATEKEAADYILRTIDDLGDIAGRIRGMHLQCSLSGDYVTHALKKRPRGLTLEAEMAHIAAIDEHKPFQTDAMRRVIDRMRPDHLVHELYYDNLSHMHTMLTRTQELLGLR